ncbi:hypothetical protein NQ314_013521 [Rhamnusium bicolor]|uniref:Ycf1 n=1 Tax=Rhamnusium bicolor TaxID=1586634 RepID=A0AAV8X6H4_9CUCU|nr:hypothetical protein NQ314_013521 [Rhamnusium bicolor]
MKNQNIDLPVKKENHQLLMKLKKKMYKKINIVKKITLKRPTLEEKFSINEEKLDRKTEDLSGRQSCEEFSDKKRRLSSLCEDKSQDIEGNIYLR